MIEQGDAKLGAVVAVFASPLWSDQARLRLWVKQVAIRTDAPVGLVLLTDDSSDANTVLARQLRCSNVVTSVMRAGGTSRNPEARRDACVWRDATMFALANQIVVFGCRAGSAQIAWGVEWRAVPGLVYARAGLTATLYSEDSPGEGPSLLPSRNT